MLFHNFPGSCVTKAGTPRVVSAEEEESRRGWLHAIRREEKKGVFSVVPYSTVVCSNHFLESDYVQGVKKSGAKLKAGAVPSAFAWTAKRTPSRKAPLEHSDHEYPAAKRTKEPTGDALSHREALRKCTSLEKELAEAKGALDDVEAELCSKQFSLRRVEQSDSDIQYYTGFPSIVAFDACVRFLRLSEGNVISCRSKSKDNRERSRGGGRKSKMTLREKFFITIVRLRQGLIYGCWQTSILWALLLLVDSFSL